MLSRRRLLADGTAFICLACAARASFSQKPPTAAPPILVARAIAPVCGDSKLKGSSSDSAIRRLTRSGISEVDKYLPEEMSLLNRLFRIEPQFSYFDDQGIPQARTYPIGESDSEVLLGVNLVATERSRHGRGWQTAVIGILAHEWAHACQYSTRLEEQTFLWETHADFLAGWYLGCKVAMGLVGLDIDVFAAALYVRGNTSGYFDPNDYGQPEVRVAAMRAGYEHGIRWFEPRKLPDLYYAMDQGYVVASNLRR